MNHPTEQELWRALSEVSDLPFGRSTSARLEGLVATADAAGHEEVAASARIALMNSYRFGGEAAKQFAPFAWLLKRYDERPDWFSEYEHHHVLWMYKWVTSDMLDFSEVPLERIQAGVEDMAVRYATAGELDGPVLGIRFSVAAHLLGHEAAHDAYLAWVRAPRTELSDCEACEQSRRVRHLVALGRHEEAVELAMPVLSGETTCDQQPHKMIQEAMEPLLLTGRAELAAQEHVRGVRLLRGGTHSFCYAGHLLVCARTGRLQRGLDLFERWVATAVGGLEPGELIRFTAAAARLLTALVEAGHGDLPVTPLPPAVDQSGRVEDSPDLVTPGTVAGFAERMTATARSLAARFDTRNGTSTVGGEVAAVLATGPLPEVPIDAYVRTVTIASAQRADHGRGVGRASAPGAADDTGGAPNGVPAGTGPVVEPVPVQLPDDPAGLSETYRQAQEIGDDARAETVLAAWRERRAGGASVPDPDGGADPDGHASAPDPDGADAIARARLDLWVAQADLSDLSRDSDTVLAAVRTAVGALSAAGAVGEALVGEQHSLVQAVGHGRRPAGEVTPQVIELAGRVRELGDPRVLGRSLATVVVAQLRSRAAAVPGQDPAAVTQVDPEVVREGIALLRSVPAGDLDHRERSALMLLLRVRAEDVEPEEAESALREAVVLAPAPLLPMGRALARADLAQVVQRRDPAEAVDVWQAAVADAEAAGDRGFVGRLLGSLAETLRAADQPQGAVSALSRAVPLLEEKMPLLSLEARFDLSRALLDIPNPALAGEVAESLLADLTATLAEHGDRLDDGPDAPGAEAGDATVRGGAGETRPDPGDSGAERAGTAAGAGTTPGAGAEAVAPSAPRRDLFLAGAAAYAAAEASALAGDHDHGRRMAETSARWHARSVNPLAEAEAWQFAAQLAESLTRARYFARAAALAEQGGDWMRAATCRRWRIPAVHEADGIDAALGALVEALAEIDRHRAALEAGLLPEPDPDHRAGALAQVLWHRLATVEQGARTLAQAGRFTEALDDLDGLENTYRDLGDERSVRDVLGLRGEILVEVGDLEDGLELLRRAAEEALAQDDHEHSRMFGGRLAARLDDAGRREEAETVWARFGG